MPRGSATTPQTAATRGQQVLEHLGRCLPWASQEEKQPLSIDLAWPWSFPVVNPKLTYLVKGSQPGWSETREQFCKLSLAPER